LRIISLEVANFEINFEYNKPLIKGSPKMDAKQLDKRRIGIYLLFAFGISWATGLVIALTGGLTNSPRLFSGSALTLAFLLLATFYMWGPALAHVATRLVTREGWQELYLVPNLQRGWPYWLIGWFLPGILTILGAALYFALFSSSYDPTMAAFRQQVQALTGADLPVPPMGYAVSQAIQAMLIAPILNALATFGEEFGWRAYLQPKLMPLGGRKAVLLVGLVWGVWHWPVIAMGYNYGFDYPGFPWLGMLMMVWFTVVLAVIFGWLVLRGGSVWPSVIAHGALNGIAALGGLFLAGKPNMLLGPTPVGLVASLPFALVALWILLSRRALRPFEEEAAGALVDGAAATPNLQ
jgi:membrane protease YdiL (CAAX protease family)